MRSRALLQKERDEMRQKWKLCSCLSNDCLSTYFVSKTGRMSKVRQTKSRWTPWTVWKTKIIFSTSSTIHICSVQCASFELSMHSDSLVTNTERNSVFFTTTGNDSLAGFFLPKDFFHVKQMLNDPRMIPILRITRVIHILISITQSHKSNHVTSRHASGSLSGTYHNSIYVCVLYALRLLQLPYFDTIGAIEDIPPLKYFVIVSPTE